MQYKKKLLLTLLSSLFLLLAYYHISTKYIPTKIKKIYLTLPHLPEEFEGLTIGHLSDLHCGNFKNKEELAKGIDLLMQEAPDIIFITGDVIERYVEEIQACSTILKRIKAKEGIYVILGNHEYGPTHLHKARDSKHIAAIKKAEEALGWKLLLNENHMITREKSTLAIIGVENYSTGVWPTYGDLTKASQGTEKANVRLLLSHDPTHWEAEVIDHPHHIDITFSGHTHGASFKITRGPKKRMHFYIYKQYNGLYEKNNHKLYVSSGLGHSKRFGRRLKKREVTLFLLSNKQQSN